MLPEPSGGAHSDWDEVARSLEEALYDTVKKLSELSSGQLIESRRSKYDSIGTWREA